MSSSRSVLLGGNRVGKLRVSHQAVIALVLASAIGMAIVYVNVMTYDPVLTPETGYSDTQDYISLYRGETASGIRAFRPLVPWLARLVPDFPASIFDTGRDVSRELQIVLKFGAVNYLFLVAASLTLFELQRSLGLDGWASLLGMALFLSLPTVVRSAGLPMTDTAFYFFFCLALWAVLKRNWAVLLAASTLGVMAKELALLVMPLILLTKCSWKTRLRLLLAVLPALFVVILLRFWMPAINLASGWDDGYLSGSILGLTGYQLRWLFSASGLVDMFMAFTLAWPLAIYALVVGDVPDTLRSWIYLLPIVILGVLLGAGNLSRSTVAAFPVIIPLAAIGLQRLSRLGGRDDWASTHAS